MEDCGMPWDGSPGQREALQTALDQLHDRNISDGALADAIQKNRSFLVAQYPELDGVTIDRSNLCRWRTDTKRFNRATFKRLMLVYNFIETSPVYHTDAIKSKHTTVANTFSGYCSAFFKIKRPALDHLSEVLTGKFHFYQYSQTIPDAIVIGLFEIVSHHDGSLVITEQGVAARFV
jgi:hypothetical protein